MIQRATANRRAFLGLVMGGVASGPRALQETVARKVAVAEGMAAAALHGKASENVPSVIPGGSWVEHEQKRLRKSISALAKGDARERIRREIKMETSAAEDPDLLALKSLSPSAFKVIAIEREIDRRIDARAWNLSDQLAALMDLDKGEH